MRISKSTLILAAMLTVPAGFALAQVPNASLENTVIDGTVGDVFGNRFILEDETGRVLVETRGDLAPGAAIATGDSLVIVGSEGPNGFTAIAITREDGTDVLAGPAATDAAPAAPATPGAPTANLTELEATALLETMGFSAIRLDEIERNHFEFEARDADGRNVDIELGIDGTLTQFDVEDDARATSVNLAALLPEIVQSLVAENGISDIQEFEAGQRHYTVEGYTASGSEIEIEINRDGTLRKFDLDDNARAGSIDLTNLLPAEARDMIAERGIVDVHEFEIERDGYQVEGYTAEGREIEIEIGFNDRTGMVSVDDGRGPAPASFDETAIVGSVEAAGYAVGSVERKPRHLEVAATNPEGETVLLHVDFAGEVYMERLVR